MLSQDLVAHARLKYLGTSAQKTRLVVDLIRGKPVGDAIAMLGTTHKAVAREIGRVLDSAVANARQKRQDLDVDRLYVHTAFVDGGPSLKRIRPAPMGRAFRIQRRMCHVTLGLGQIAAPKPQERRAAPKEAPAAAAPAGTAVPTERAARQAPRRKPAGAAKKRAPAAKKKAKRATKARS